MTRIREEEEVGYFTGNHVAVRARRSRVQISAPAACWYMRAKQNIFRDLGQAQIIGLCPLKSDRPLELDLRRANVVRHYT